MYSRAIVRWCKGMGIWLYDVAVILLSSVEHLYLNVCREDFNSQPSGFDSNASRQKFEKVKNANKRNPVPAEARRWYRQAQADIRSAYNDYNAEEPAYEWVLLKAHQVCSKCLFVDFCNYLFVIYCFEVNQDHCIIAIELWAIKKL